MSPPLHLPVLGSAGDVTQASERFRCARLSAVLFAHACVARQTATRRISPVATQILHIVCAGCPEGHALTARLEGRDAPEATVVPTPAPARPEPARCACAGCARFAALPHRRAPAELTPLCVHHRAEVRRHQAERGVDLATALAWTLAGARRPAPEPDPAEATPCPVHLCTRKAARVTVHTHRAWAPLCAHHRLAAGERQRRRPDETPEQVLAVVLGNALGQRAPYKPRRNPASTVAAEVRDEIERQHKLAVLRAKLRGLRREAARVSASIGSLTGRSACA